MLLMLQEQRGSGWWWRWREREGAHSDLDAHPNPRSPLASAHSQTGRAHIIMMHLRGLQDRAPSMYLRENGDASHARPDSTISK